LLKRREEERRGEEDEGFKAGEIWVFGGELIETVVSVVCISRVIFGCHSHGGHMFAVMVPPGISFHGRRNGKCFGFCKFFFCCVVFIKD
jgi:hypothetical protein